MSPEQFTEFLVSNEKATGKAIEKYVNGGIRKMQENLENHAKEDKAFQDRAEPMLKVFENNNIFKYTIEKDTRKIVFWATSLTAIGVFLAGLGWLASKIGLIFFTKP